eukprot:gene12694-26741_t
MLEGALRSSNAQFEPPYILDRISVRLLEASPGDSGWEIFSLEYAVDPPLTAVHARALSSYRTAFHMLWRLKRTEWTLAASWKQLMCFSHSGGMDALPRLKPILHKCTLQRTRMSHFVNNLCEYLMFEVMELSWNRLQELLSRATSLDDVIKAHDTYLLEIEEKALLSSTHETLYMLVQQILQAVLRYCNLEETLLSDAVASVTRKRALLGQGHKKKHGRRGSDGQDISQSMSMSMSMSTIGIRGDDGDGDGNYLHHPHSQFDAPDSVDGLHPFRAMPFIGSKNSSATAT